jgi:hypothetical protein
MELLPLLLLHPPISGYYAKSKGHSFWFWFFMGLFLPIVSNIILYFLKDKEIHIDAQQKAPVFVRDKTLYIQPGFDYKSKNE